MTEKPYKIKPLICSMSLTCVKTVCPYCKYENPDRTEFNNRSIRHKSMTVLPYYDKPLDYCPACGKQYDAENLDIRKSKEYKEVEALGLKGAVAKDDKGKWYEVKY